MISSEFTGLDALAVYVLFAFTRLLSLSRLQIHIQQKSHCVKKEYTKNIGFNMWLFYMDHLYAELPENLIYHDIYCCRYSTTYIGTGDFGPIPQALTCSFTNLYNTHSHRHNMNNNTQTNTHRA